MEEKKYKKIDYLLEDDPIPRQNWVCISFLSPEGIRNCSLRGLKIRGVYQTKEQADERAKYLQEVDPDFDVFVGEVGKWLPWDPDPTTIEDQHHQNEELNKIAQGYQENLKKVKKMHQERVNESKENYMRKEKTRKEKAQDRLRQKIEKRKAEQRAQNIVKRQMNTVNKNENQVKPKRKRRRRRKKTQLESQIKIEEEKIQEIDEMTKEETKRLNNNKEIINKTEQEISNIDDKLARMKELYKKINKK